LALAVVLNGAAGPWQAARRPVRRARYGVHRV